MSAAAEGSGPTAKATTATDTSTLKDQQAQKPAAALEEDDEFEDFPVDDWAPEDSEVPPGQEGGTTHLWEESWDDDDTSEDFSKQLKEELAKVKGQK
ncbi:26S proteasome complex subunit [Imshaugia aleurites]|uniref:26S proteasome complex subunit SEM1 n=1 Tax=Imshaugia aleurites TaxID=172621 RepID=A0A8H3I907_9LECA|nr:26S proteasome complex subunit [Imshaugia aleurites]